MLQIDYTGLIKKSWLVTWKNRFLWKFGAILALTGLLGNFSRVSDISKDDKFYSTHQDAIMNFVQANLSWIIIAGIVFFVVYLAIAVLAILAQAGLIDSLKKVLVGEKTSFLSGMKTGKAFFWKMLGMKVMIGIATFFSILILAIPIIILIYYGDVIASIILGIIALVIIISIIVIGSFLNNFGQMYLVLGNIGILSALENSYALFRRYLSNNMILLLIFIPIGIVVSFIYILAVVVIAAIFTPIGALTYYLVGKTGIIIIAVLGGLIALLVLWVVQSIFQVFLQSLWMLYFYEIAKEQKKELAENLIKELKLKEGGISETDPVMRMENQAEIEDDAK